MWWIRSAQPFFGLEAALSEIAPEKILGKWPNELKARQMAQCATQTPCREIQFGLKFVW